MFHQFSDKNKNDSIPEKSDEKKDVISRKEKVIKIEIPLANPECEISEITPYNPIPTQPKILIPDPQALNRLMQGEQLTPDQPRPPKKSLLKRLKFSNQHYEDWKDKREAVETMDSLSEEKDILGSDDQQSAPLRADARKPRAFKQE